VITPAALRDFWERHPDAEAPLRAWLSLTRHANWRTPHEVKATFPLASLLGDELVVFNIGGRGKGYRLSVNVRYRTGRIYVRQVLTHDDYLGRTRKGTL